MIDLQPVLTGDLLVARPMVAADWDGLYYAASDPLIWDQHPEHDRWRAPVFRRFFDAALASGGALTLIDRGDGTTIGSSRYYDVDPAGHSVTIGYSFLARRCWGGAYNRELKRMMITHLHRFVPTALFQVDVHNQRSQAALRKIGARARPAHLCPPGKAVFEVVRP